MGVNHIELSTGETLMDLREDGVTSETLDEGVTAHNSEGEPIVGVALRKSGRSVKSYGAKGDGVTDDTLAFKTALANNRIVYVPEGEYLISEPLVIRENCEFELAQSAVLKFTQTDKNCITLLRLASLKGNHATICVPYEFSASVLYSSTEEDLKAVPDTNGDGSKVAENTTAVPPFTKWSPQWKMSRYVTDINICKTMGDTYKGTYADFHYSKTGDTAGKAVSMVCADDGGEDYMWGINMSGLRIAGAFEYGIYIKNSGEAWNHDMRIEAVIDACKTAVYAENCNTAHLNVTFQPRVADNDAIYAEHGIHLVNCKYTDVSSCFLWDWQYVKQGFKRVAMYGSCPGLLVSIPNYDKTTGDISEHIYSENQSNLDNMTFLQESGGSKDFVSKEDDNGNIKPYFYDGNTEKELTIKEEFFDVDIIKQFDDALEVATDTDGNIFGEKGYRTDVRLQTDGSLVSSDGYYGCTGLIPCKKGDTIYIEGINLKTGASASDGIPRIILLNESFVKTASRNQAHITETDYFVNCFETEKGYRLKITEVSDNNSVAYIRFNFHVATGLGKRPMISVKNEIKYEQAGFLADSVKVKAENVVGLTGGSGDFIITVTGDEENGYTASATYEEIMTAFNERRNIFCHFSSDGHNYTALPLIGTYSGRIEFGIAIPGTTLSLNVYNDNTIFLDILSAPITVSDQVWDGSEAVDFTDAVADIAKNFIFEVTGDDENGYTSTATFDEIVAEFNKGKTILCHLIDDTWDVYCQLIQCFQGESNDYDEFVSFAYTNDGCYGVYFFIYKENSSVKVYQHENTIQIGDKIWCGEEGVDFTVTINNMIDEKVENLDSDNGVVWLEGTLSAATMTVTNLSFTYQQIVDLLSQNKLIKFKGNYEQGVVIGDIVLHNTAYNSIIIQAMMKANYGDGLKLYYFSININSDDSVAVEPYIINTTSIGG